MAKIKLNPVLEGFRGKIGDLVFKRQSGGLVVCRIPTRALTEPSRAAKVARDRFRSAAAYAKAAITDPTTKPLYAAAAKEAQTPLFAVAMADYFHAPTVETIDRSGYSGRAGQTIQIRAYDNVQVARVQVVIRDDSGAVLEEGDAGRNGSDSSWTYTTTTNLPANEVVSIEATATDHPGNATSKSVNYPE